MDASSSSSFLAESNSLHAQKDLCCYGEVCYRLNERHLRYKRHKHLDDLLPAYKRGEKISCPVAELKKTVLLQLEIMRGFRTAKAEEAPNLKQVKPPARKGNGVGKSLLRKDFEESISSPVPDIVDGDKCPVCMEGAFGAGSAGSSILVQLRGCSHRLCSDCLSEGIDFNAKVSDSLWFKCPQCNKSYGKRTGNQPDNGTMDTTLIDMCLPGQDADKTIQMTFDFHPGIQTSQHPNAGRPFSASGFPRRAYLPNSEQGKRLAALLAEAFERRLLFTVGQSRTTGRDNTVVFNDIHLKTSIVGARGYPDPDHLTNLEDELNRLGIGDKEERRDDGSHDEMTDPTADSD